MKLEVVMDIVVLGPDFHASKEHALRFFAKTPLVRFEHVHVMEEHSISAEDPLFWQRVDEGIARNRSTLNELIHELKGYGFETLTDLVKMEQGFQSKIVHTAAHLLDGFIGIDTSFYSHAHDSHWLSETQRNEIQKTPTDYWLLQIRGEITASDSNTLAGLRSFEN